MASTELLLRAAVVNDESAIAAWEAWLRANDLDALEPAELRLLPAAHRNLVSLGIDEARLPPIARQMLRTTWIRTRLLVREAVSAASFLESHGVPAMLLKGTALIAAGDLEAGLRPMTDFDLLVRRVDAMRATNLLAGIGWSTIRPLDEERVFYLHAIGCKKGETVCDLHWRVMWETRGDAEDERFWQAAEIVQLDGVPVRIPAATHHLLHTIVHGTRLLDKTPVRWIPDAMAVLRSKRGIDWNAFVTETKLLHLEFPTGESLAYLAETFGAPVPAHVIDELCRVSVPKSLRRIYGARPLEGEVSPFAFPFAMYHRARRRGDGLFHTARTLQHTWNLPSLAHMPFDIVRRVVGRLMRRNA